MVGVGGTALAAAIRRSYLLGERAFPEIGWHGFHDVAPDLSNYGYDAFAFGSKGATFEALSENSRIDAEQLGNTLQTLGELTRNCGACRQHFA